MENFGDKVESKQYWEDTARRYTGYNVRENPISYKYKLETYGFQELKQEFINLHPLPPPILQKKNYPETLDIDETHKWKLMFMCSMFGSCSRRV